MGTVNVQPLIDEIDKRHLRDIWSDTLFETSAEEKAQRVQERLFDCIKTYRGMMGSIKNDGSESYQKWAIRKALGLSHKCNFKQTTGRRLNRSLS